MTARPVRFGLIGYGSWGKYHADAIAQTDGAQLVAIAVPSEQARQRAATAHPDCDVVADYRQLLARDDLDVVDVVVPNHLHAEVGRAVLQAGKHLLMEKPMTVTVAEAESLVAAARASNRLLAVDFQMRVSALWGGVKKLIDEGRIGTPLYIVVDLWRRPYRPGADGWRFDIRRVGDWILEEPVHFFDLARWYFLSSGEPVSVFACANSRQEGHPELEDNFSALLKFSHGGYAVITHTLCGFEHHQTVKVTGTAGAIWASWSGALDRDPHPRSSLKFFDGDRVHDVPLDRPTGELYELEDQIAMMVRAVRDGEPAPADGIDGLWSVRLCAAAQASVDRGAEIVLFPEREPD